MKEWFKSILLALGAFIFWSVAPMFTLLLLVVQQYRNGHPNEEFSLKFSLGGISFNEGPPISFLEMPNVEWVFLIFVVLTIVLIILFANNYLSSGYLKLDHRIPLKNILKWLGVTFATVVLIDVITRHANMETKAMFDISEHAGLEFLVLCLFIGVLIPFVEELIFRGLMQRAISDRFGYFFGIVSTSFLFTLIHFQYHIVDLALMYPVSLLFSLARYYTKSTLIAFFCHMLANIYFLVNAF